MVAFFLVISQSQLAESYRVIAQTPDLPWIWHMTGTSPLGQLTEVVQSLPEHALLLYTPAMSREWQLVPIGWWW